MGIVKLRFCEHCDEMTFTRPASLRCRKCGNGTKEQASCDAHEQGDDSAKPDDDETESEE